MSGRNFTARHPDGLVAEVPLTEIAVEAFRRQLAISGSGPFLFRVRKTRTSIRKRSRRPGAPLCAGREFRTFGFTTCDLPTPHG